MIPVLGDQCKQHLSNWKYNGRGERSADIGSTPDKEENGIKFGE